MKQIGLLLLGSLIAAAQTHQHAPPETKGIDLAKLPPPQKIEGIGQAHIPITTNPGVAFYLNRSRIVMEAGSAWYLRLSDPHRVYNKGDGDRVHMVVDASVNDWLKGLLTTAARQAA